MVKRRNVRHAFGCLLLVLAATAKEIEIDHVRAPCFHRKMQSTRWGSNALPLYLVTNYHHRDFLKIHNTTTVAYNKNLNFGAFASLPDRFLDLLFLLSPRTWFGVLEVQDKNIFSPYSSKILTQSLISVLMPLILLTILCHHVIPQGTTAGSNWWILGTACMSPWILQCCYSIASQLASVCTTLHFYMTSRSSTLASASFQLKERIHNQRAYRTRRYDVYLPHYHHHHHPQHGSMMQQRQQALLFLPGALVPHDAYSEVAARFSDEGFLVVVVSMEPLRWAYHKLGADPTSMIRVMEEVEQYIHSSYNSNQNNATTTTTSTTTVPWEWTLMGHSMGSFAAMKLFHDLRKEKLHNTAVTRRVNISHNLVLWGMAAFVPFATDLSKDSHAHILVVQGTKDRLWNMLKSGNDALDAYFPPQTKRVWIEGGTHDGFGSYATVNKEVSSTALTFGDEVDTTEQQNKACQITVQFLNPT